MFKRKVYDKLKQWKEKYSNNYAALLEGARRVGKSTIAEEFAKKEYKKYIKVDFANTSKEILEIFDDISNLDIFFLRLQAITNVDLVERDSVIIFDEIQLFPKARQAIKYLVKDGRYDYIETGSLISIKKNVKDILIPSEEYKINVYPMDYEEFLCACGKNTYEILRKIYLLNKPVGDSVNRNLMRDYRIYMAVGGMPQAVEAYINKKSFEEIDFIKRNIIKLYKDDFKKIDPSGRISQLYDSIPSQLALNKKRFVISSAINKRKTYKDEELLLDLLDSKTVIACYNINNPSITLSQTKNLDSFKLYIADVGLFTTMLFNDESKINIDIYNKLLSNKLSANLGFLYENAIAQIIKSYDYELYYHTWQKENSTHYYEIDFILTHKIKIIPIEVKSSSIKNHSSIDVFNSKFSKIIFKSILFSQHDVNYNENINYLPIYLASFSLEE